MFKYLLLLSYFSFAVLFGNAVADDKVNDKVNDKADKTDKASQAEADEMSSEQYPTLVFELTGLDIESDKENALAFLDIDGEAGKPVKNESYTEYLADVGVMQIQKSLQPFGYYLAEVNVNIKKTSKQWTISYQVNKGKAVHVNSVNVEVLGQGTNNSDFTKLLAKFPLHKGDVLLQEKYTDFKNKVLSLALANGYFDGDFTKTEIVLSNDLLTADIRLVYDTGDRYTVGETTFEQDFLDDDVFKRYVQYEKGEVYTAESIADLQRDLYNSGYVKVIDVDAKPNKNDKTVPIKLAITPPKNKKHTFALGYGSDTGARARYDFDWRWVNRRGHQFKSNALASQKLLQAYAQYHIPAENPATDHYKLFATIKRDLGGDVRSTMANVGAAYRDKIFDFTREVGVKWQHENFTVGNDSGEISLLTPYAAFTYKKADDLININEGLLIKGEITGASDGVISDLSFIQLTAKAKYIKRIGESNKFTVSGAIGRTWTDNFRQLPANYRFFTGGDKTIRGYAFNSIGDHDSSGANVGGDKMYYASGEYEYFFREEMGLAVFIDAGDAYSKNSADLKVGAGIGYRYYSPVGPIKVDVAHGFQEPGDDYRLHFSVGPEL